MQKILIADDDQLNISLYSGMLKKSGYKIFEASDGFETLRIAREELPDLIIMDWNMPRIDGLEALKIIKKEEKTKTIPVIMITGIMTSSDNLKMALQEGAVEFLRKPFDKIELQARVNSMLMLSKAMKSLHDNYFEVKNSHRFIQSLIDNFTHALVYYTLDGIVIGCNILFAEILQVNATELRGKLIYRYYQGENSNVHLDMDMELIHHQEEIKYESAFGIGHDYIFSKSLFYDSADLPQGILCVMTNITEMKRAHQKMMENKKKELVSSALRLIQVSEFNNQLIYELSRLSVYTSIEDRQNIRNIVHQYSFSSGEGVWKDFESRFEQVYETFYKQLMKRFPDLTPGERKLCALLRLNVSSKDIAAITSQNSQSVDMARYRLRKKLNLCSDDNLIDFLMKIES